MPDPRHPIAMTAPAAADPPGPTRPGARVAGVAAVAAAASYAAFVLPYRWPPTRRLVSPSYAFGFNNLVAIVAVAALLGALALVLAARPAAGAGARPPLRFARDASGGRRTWLPLAVLLLVYAALTVAMYAYTVRAEPFVTWESRHFLHRLLLMDRYGLEPYTQLHAEYGPALTLTPLYVYRLLAPLGATHAQAYFACHLLLNALGLACLHYTLRRVAMPERRRAIAFALLAVAGFAPYMGLNGVLLRYLCPVASLLVGDRVVRGLVGGAAPGRRWVAAGAVVLALLGANVLLSPEVGLAFALAWLAYGAALARRDWRVLAVSLAAVAAAAVLCRATLPPAYYATLLRFSEGANNLPIVPAPHLVLYLVTLFLAVPPLLAAGLRTAVGAGTPDDPAAGALAGALGALCVVLAPGALGRADPPHLLFYGLAASLLLLARLADAPGRGFALYAAAYAAVHVALTPVVLLVQFYGVAPRLLLSRAGPSHVAERLRAAAATRPDPADLAPLDRYARVAIPFATYGDPAVERYVIERGRLAPEYYIATVGVYTEAVLDRKLRDVAGHEYLLVPAGYETRWSRDKCAELVEQLRRSTLYPARLPCRAASLDPDAAVNDLLVDRYAPVERVAGWVVLRRTGRAAAAPR